VTLYGFPIYRFWAYLDEGYCRNASCTLSSISAFLLRQAGGFFFPGTPLSSTNRPDRHDITEIVLKVALKTLILAIILLYNSSLSKFILILVIFFSEMLSIAIRLLKKTSLYYFPYYMYHKMKFRNLIQTIQ
jgi:hypothetical protein